MNRKFLLVASVLFVARMMLACSRQSSLSSPPTKAAQVATTAPQADQTQQAQASGSSQISGHIYRKDTGAPIENALVEIQPAQGGGSYKWVRTTVDGSYSEVVDPGKYWISAYRTGFISEKFEVDNPLSGCLWCISVGRGRKVDAIDLRLAPNPPITSLKLPSELTGFDFRLSPSGKLLVFWRYGRADFWLYDMSARRLVSAGDLPVGSSRNDPRLSWADDDTLYLKTGGTAGALVGGYHFFRLSGVAAAMREATPRLVEQSIPSVPDDGVIPLLSGESDFEPSGHEVKHASNGRYTLTWTSPCGQCGHSLSVRSNDGSWKQSIPEDAGADTDNVPFDKNRSLVLYWMTNPTYGRSGIVVFDLKTRQSRETLVPSRGGMRDAVPNGGDGTIVAYVNHGGCELDDSTVEARSRLLHGPNPQQIWPDSENYAVCFLQVP